MTIADAARIGALVSTIALVACSGSGSGASLHDAGRAEVSAAGDAHHRRCLPVGAGCRSSAECCGSSLCTIGGVCVAADAGNPNVNCSTDEACGDQCGGTTTDACGDVVHCTAAVCGGVAPVCDPISARCVACRCDTDCGHFAGYYPTEYWVGQVCDVTSHACVSCVPDGHLVAPGSCGQTAPCASCCAPGCPMAPSCG